MIQHSWFGETLEEKQRANGYMQEKLEESETRETKLRSRQKRDEMERDEEKTFRYKWKWNWIRMKKIWIKWRLTTAACRPPSTSIASINLQ